MDQFHLFIKYTAHQKTILYFLRFIITNLKKYRFKQVTVKSLGFGPFIASYSLAHSYIKFIPIFSHLCLLLAYILDSVIQVFVKTDLKEIYPIGYFFIAKK